MFWNKKKEKGKEDRAEKLNIPLYKLREIETLEDKLRQLKDNIFNANMGLKELEEEYKHVGDGTPMQLSIFTSTHNYRRYRGELSVKKKDLINATSEQILIWKSKIKEIENKEI